MYYRGVRFTRDYIIRYLTSVFMSANKGSLILWDGTKNIKFSDAPHVMSKFAWTPRHLPAVLVSPASGSANIRSVNKDYAKQSEVGDMDQFNYYAGDYNFSFDLDIRAKSTTEKDNLVDIVSLFLSIPAAKDYFQKHAIKLSESVSIGMESTASEYATEYPVFSTVVGLDTHSSWEYKEDLEDRLEDVFIDVELVSDLPNDD